MLSHFPRNVSSCQHAPLTVLLAARAGAPVELQDGTGVLRYWPSLFSPSTQERLFRELTQDPNLAPPPTMEANNNSVAGRWTQRPITLFGKEIMQPRLTCFYGREGVTYK